jgi:hypothetical protein
LGFVAVEATGDGLAAGLAVEPGVVAGAAGVVLAGEGAVAGDDVVAGEFELELVAGSSAQPTAKAIARTAGSNNMVRLKSFVFELLIFFLVRARLKSTMMIARSQIGDNECSHRSSAGSTALLKP